MDMGIGDAAGRDIDAVAAPQVAVARFQVDIGRQFVGGGNAVAGGQPVIVRRTGGDELVAQQARAVGTGGNGNIVGRKPGRIGVQRRTAASVADRRHAAGDVNAAVAARQGRREGCFFRQNVGVKSQDITRHVMYPPCYVTGVSQRRMGGKKGGRGSLTPTRAGL